MRAFSPLDAAYEGIRVVRREPRAVVYWLALWAVALTLITVLLIFSRAPTGNPTDEWRAFRRFGPLAIIVVPTLLILWLMSIAAVYRAVLRPGEHGWHLFKLGPDEARIAAVTGAATVLLLMLGIVPAYLLYVALTPAFELAPALNKLIALVGVLGTIAIDAWIGVRLSLTAVHTFAERRFPLAAYWGFARGHFWRVLASYALVVLEFLAFLAVWLALVLGVGWLAEGVRTWHGGGLLRQAVLWLLIPAGAVLEASYPLALVILPCACQAFIYRAITAEHAAPTGTGAAAVTSPNPA